MLGRTGIYWLLGIAGLLASAAVQAELLDITYTTPEGETASVRPDVAYMNPTGQMTFALSAGLDRKVRIQLHDSAGELVADATSALIGGSDQIKANGDSFYGARLSLPSPDEGEYVAVAKILDNSGGTVQSESYRWTLDRSGYSFNGLPVASQYRRYGQPDGPWSFVSGRNALTINAAIIGEGAPPTKATLTVTSKLSGAVATYDGFELSEDMVSGSLPAGSDIWPDREADYALEFKVVDAAGNTGSLNWETRFDYTPDPFELIGISYEGDDREHPWAHIPGLEEFAAYEPGMKIDIYNPRALVRIKKEELYPFNKSGLYASGYCTQFCLTRDVVYESGDYAYLLSGRYTLNDYAPHGYTVEGADLSDRSYNQIARIGAREGVPVRPRWRFTSIRFVDGDVIDGYNTKRNISQNELYAEFEGRLAQPYDYDLIAKAQDGSTTLIPAGTVDFATEVTPFYARYARYTVCTLTKPEMCEVGHVSVAIDKTAPALNEWVFVEEDIRAYKVVIEEQFSISDHVWGLQSASLVATNAQGKRYVIDSADTTQAGRVYTVTFPLASLPTGTYEFSVEAVDKFDNPNSWVLETRAHDGQAPTVSVHAYGHELGAQPLRALGDILIELGDDATTPSLTSVKLIGGPAEDAISLAWSNTGEMRYRLEYPVMFPSLTDGDYSLVVTAIDEHGNVAESTKQFTFRPAEIGMAIDGMDSIRIPALEHAFEREDGSPLIQTAPFTLADGSVLKGTYDVYATLRNDAELPLMINGIRVEPGQTQSVVGAHDFAESGGRLAITLGAAEAGVTGRADVLVSTSAPGAPVVKSTIRVWSANMALSSDNWTIKQSIEPLAITAVPDASMGCRLTLDEDEARQANVVEDPVCHFEWNQLPSDSRVDGLEVTGYAGDVGEQPIEYSLWLYDRNGDPYLLDYGTRVLSVESAYGGIVFGLKDPVSQVYQAVEQHEYALAQQSGPECVVTLDEQQAKRHGGTRTLSCLVEWTSIPSGLERPYWENRPELAGKLENEGTNKLSWTVSVFNGSGDKILVNDQTHEIEATPPPAPTITMGENAAFAPGMYAAPLDGGYIDDARVTSFNAALEIELARNGEVFDALTMPRGWGEQNVVQRRILADKRALWSQTDYTVEARYADLPQSTFELPFTVVAVPSHQIAPEITVEGDTALNTESLPVGVRIADPYSKHGYDPDTMGLWQVRLVKLSGLKTEPLTDYEDVPLSGEKSFKVDLSAIGEPRLRLSAEARLVSEVDGYERTVVSRRPVYMSILRGQPIEAEIETRRVSGEAPLVAILSIDLANRLDQSALGAVTWEISSNKNTWTPVKGDSRYMTRLVHTFERGTYWARATVTNANSGAQLRTPMVEITAYKVPEIEIEGPENAFIGSTAHYEAVPQSPDGDLVYEWSIDRGDTWTPREGVFDLTREAVERIPVWVRGRYVTAHANDPDAWAMDRSQLSFREPVGPRVRIVGPRYVEIDKSSKYHVVIREPYRNMNIELGGRWTLPGGGQSEGPELAYTATREDLLNERVDLIYDAWIVGYEDQGATDQDDHTLRIWQYQWPEFRIRTRTSADYSPATIVARLRSMTSTRIRELEEPEIEWELPGGLTVNNASIDVQRELLVTEPGEYTLRATIRDARGHSATVEKTLVFEKAPTFEFEMTYSGSNKYNRAPMDIRVRPNVSGGHPRDRIEHYVYSLDGRELTADSRYGEMRLVQPGTHTVGVTIETRMGNTASDEIQVALNENIPPTCQIDSRKGRGYWRLYGRCDDPDGRMASYEWRMNDELIGLSGSRLTVRDDGDAVPTIQMVGTDDGGARSRPILWSGG